MKKFVYCGIILSFFLIWGLALLFPAYELKAEETEDWLSELSGRILFQSDRDGDWEIYVMNIDGSNLVQLTHNRVADEYPVWSPDGTQIAFESKRDGNYDIYVMNADGSQQRRLTRHDADDRDPAWLPNGKTIAFDSTRESNQEIFFIDTDGSNLRSWTNGLGRNILPAFSPDGTRMAYTGNRYLGWNVYVMNLDKTDDTRISDGHGACRPDWSPDSARIAFVSQKADGKGDIWTMNPDGSGKQQLTFDSERYDYDPEWSPDGKHLLYAKTDDKKRGNWDIYVMTSDGKHHAQLTTHPARDKFPNWAAGTVPDHMVLTQEFKFEAESLPRMLGEIVEDRDASQQKAVAVDHPAQPGFLVYGPYHPLAPANYLATFDIRAETQNEDTPFAVLDVVTDRGQTTLVRQEIRKKDVNTQNEYQEFQLPFSLNDEKDVEFRVYVFPHARIRVDAITVTVRSVR